MNQERVIYETLIGSRCADSHWSKVKSLMAACELPMDKDGLNVIINLRKVCPRYFRKYTDIKEQLTAMGRELKPAFDDGVSGNEFLSIINNYNINPDQSTISRWFKPIGGFKRTKEYDKQTILPIVACALIYKARKHSEDISNASNN